MVDIDGDQTVLGIVMNELAFKSLNSVPYEPSETTAEAIDMLANRVRVGSLALTLGLLEVAAAIREGNGG